MKKFFAMLLLANAVGGTVFTSCSKDEKPQAEEPKGKYDVLGLWTIMDVKIGDRYERANGEAGLTLHLKADGTFQTTVDELSLRDARFEYDKEDTITITGKLEWHDGSTVEVTRTIVIVSLKDGAFEIKMKGKYILPDDPEAEPQAELKGRKI